MKKWKYELIVLALALCIGGSYYGLKVTKDIRKANSDYKQLVKYAQRQAIEITIIEQASKLDNYKKQLKNNKVTKDVNDN